MNVILSLSWSSIWICPYQEQASNHKIISASPGCQYTSPSAAWDTHAWLSQHSTFCRRYRSVISIFSWQMQLLVMPILMCIRYIVHPSILVNFHLLEFGFNTSSVRSWTEGYHFWWGPPHAAWVISIRHRLLFHICWALPSVCRVSWWRSEF